MRGYEKPWETWKMSAAEAHFPRINCQATKNHREATKKGGYILGGRDAMHHWVKDTFRTSLGLKRV